MNKLFQNRRKTIGVLINSVDGFYQSPVWRGIKKVAEEKNFDVLFFAGGSLQSIYKDGAKQNVIYDLVNIDKLDGLIICSALLLNRIGLDKFVEFIEFYRHIPMVSIGIEIKDIPSVIFNNRECMYLMVKHLIEHHKYSKIAFITGTSLNPEAVMRFEGYKDALKEHNISFDHDLIIEGDFHESSVTKAIDEIVLNRNKKPHVIVSANDEMAIEVFYRMKEMGIEVGTDIALTGFDNVEIVRSLSPAFTTIEQPIFEMASKAAELIDLILNGQDVPQCTYLKGKLIVRESCGCSNILKNKNELTLKKSCNEEKLYYKECEDLENYLVNEQYQIGDLILRELGIYKAEILEYDVIISRLLDCFIRDIKTRKIEGEFIKGFKELLVNSIFIKNHDYCWNESIHAIRNFVLSVINNYEVLMVADEIFYLTGMLIGDILKRRESIKQINFKRMYIGTRDIMAEFNSVQNFQELTKVISTAMSWYQMKQCYLCIYDTPVTSLLEAKFRLPSKTKLILGYNEGKLAEIQYLDTLDILPKQFLYQQKRNDLILFPLVTDKEYFGYVALDMNAVDEFVYETFRAQISNALKIRMLFDERMKAEEQLNLAVIELEKSNGELKNRYVIDELTGIFNRRGFYMHGGNLYKSAAMTGGKAIICFADMNDLKGINDTYGHKAGDDAILAVALLIKASFGTDDIVARIGGDEFTIIAANKSTIDEIDTITQRIKLNFDKYNETSKKPYRVSISLGFSVYSEDTRFSFEDLIHEADKQLYKEKKKLKISSRR